MRTMKQLSTQELGQKLSHLAAWHLHDDKLLSTKEFQNFKDAMKHANAIASIAEEMNHHPDIHISFRKVTLTLWTHSVGGVTEKDVELARAIDGIV